MDLAIPDSLFWNLTPRLLGKLADRHLAKHGQIQSGQSDEEMLLNMNAWVIRTKDN